MLKKRANLPADLIGVEATGKITKSDYDNILKPMVEEAHRTKTRSFPV